MLQIANAFFKLPGDYLLPTDDEITGFKNRLNERLSPTTPQSDEDLEWDVGDCVAQWWRPNHETFLYPFLPAHVSRPKELKKLYLIHLPKKKLLSVPKNMKLLAVPLFELYDNAPRYGPQLSAIPHYLSRYRFEFVAEDGTVEARMPGLGADGGGTNGMAAKVLVDGDGGGDEQMHTNGHENEGHDNVIT
ncbi:Pre-mRNA cleavage factor Im 25 kDa subunit 2 [Cyphellophora attinorum]|uniref:Pre-mRNA cleavage factor Im 25 kDa subunit 2 n=1 Tax=Cyphellophora attinorum TaxID=1664694 RepID=A0A0N1H9S0_9EURO|nr:Pre-mRNA cleavage factor Im 25 kDa subunit 2 [Phialophora attinorum]KPI39004.1 Pre-mRNA cleavage factor Im 25 kDa subunit 2 [Phialophora attinorum]